MIQVTQPALAPLDEYIEKLQSVWASGILTHNGPLVQQLEKELCGVIGLDQFVAVSNGTIALQMAIKALGLSGSGGEILTTPFTWVATLSAIQWEGCKPTFCDIDPSTFNIDPAKVAEAITPKTVAIMPVHVFGNPCDVELIDEIAKDYGLPVIYDAAHAIGSTYDNKSLLNWGDISATSLHATKIFNTAEGGGCITKDVMLHEKLKRIRFFGHDAQKQIVEEGFNAEMTEVHAALGLANIKYHNQVLADRKQKYLLYKNLLGSCDKIQLQTNAHGETNYSYFAIVLKSEERLLKVQQELLKNEIVPRRYFYPSANTLNHIISDQKPMPISESISSRILCLPLYWKLHESVIEKICHLVIELS